MHRLQAKRHAATRSMRGKSDLGIEGLVHVVREGVEGDMGDDLGVAVSGVTDLSDLGWRDGTTSHCQCPGEFDSAAALGSFEVPLRLAAISLPSSLANFVPVKVWAERQQSQPLASAMASAMRSRVPTAACLCRVRPGAMSSPSMRRSCWKPAGRCSERNRSAFGWYRGSDGRFLKLHRWLRG